MELTTRAAAEQLGVNQSRVRALVASGSLIGRQVGGLWLVDADSLDRHASLTAAKANGRSMAPRIAWAAGDLADGGDAVWLTASERSRLRKRFAAAASIDTLRRWLSARAWGVNRYRVGERDLDEVLATAGVVRTGVSATTAYGIGLGVGGTGDAYVDSRVAQQLVQEFFLIESAAGNLTLRMVEQDLHLKAAREIEGQLVSTRLIVGVDLADDRDTRTKSAGRELLGSVLFERNTG